MSWKAVKVILGMIAIGIVATFIGLIPLLNSSFSYEEKKSLILKPNQIFTKSKQLQNDNDREVNDSRSDLQYVNRTEMTTINATIITSNEFSILRF